MSGEIINGRYVLGDLIGAGGMADVYRATDNLLGRTVAVKILHPQYAKDPVFVERFKREAQAAANLNHPNVVSVYDWGIEGDTSFLVMEYIQGKTLKDIIIENGPLLPERAIEIAIAICSALEAAHKQGIVHRDIKPQNVTVTRSNQIKVTDFGIARAVGDSAMTQTGTIMGTAQYISPEQAQGQSADPRSDLYSLGIVLYEMLTGRVPFDGETPVAIAYKHVREDPLPPSMLNPDIPPELEAVVMKALAKNPDNRYQSAPEMQADLERCLEGAPVYATPVLQAEDVSPTEAFPLSPAPSVAKRRSNTWAWVVLGVIIALACGIGVWAALGAGKIAVPNLVGKKLVEAEKILEQKGLKIKVIKTVRDPEKAKDVIISQEPSAGKRISKNGTVKVVVNAGPEEVAVPNLVGLSSSEAAGVLKKYDLELGTVTETFHDSVEKGKIASQSPSAGEKVPKGTKVNIAISKGQEIVTVPDVVGIDVEAATKQLEKAGLSVQKEEQASTEKIGKVLSQTPAAGERVPKGTSVTIVVAIETKMVTVPSVVGKDASEARSILEGKGFTVEEQTTEVKIPSEKNKVQGQNPQPGANVPEGSTVTIFVEAYNF
ncbi:MAG: Stk1 family PASTA domain-containing Ser/Thr kinase [Actinomycetota bacterium]|nr:Stk1 family PASTA domain-containing Ser/Thr kinase [Actinomycetota bacterium]